MVDIICKTQKRETKVYGLVSPPMPHSSNYSDYYIVVQCIFVHVVTSIYFLNFNTNQTLQTVHDFFLYRCQQADKKVNFRPSVDPFNNDVIHGKVQKSLSFVEQILPDSKSI